MNIKTLGIDLAKNVFQLHGVDAAGNVTCHSKMIMSGFVQNENVRF